MNTEHTIKDRQDMSPTELDSCDVVARDQTSKRRVGCNAGGPGLLSASTIYLEAKPKQMFAQHHDFADVSSHDEMAVDHVSRSKEGATCREGKCDAH